MKARLKQPEKILMSREEITEIVNSEFQKKYYNLYAEAVQDISIQVLAGVLVTLDLWYGWKKDRLKKFVQTIHSQEDDMVDHNFSNIDNINRIKDLYGIDLEKEFPAHVAPIDAKPKKVKGIWE